MAHIVFAPRPETGHLNATLGLARRLAAAGHRISYLTLPDYVAHIAAQGFAARPMLAAAFPLGWLRQARARSFGDRPWRAWWRTRAEALRTFHAILAEPFDAHVAALSPDALLIDRELPALALRAVAHGLPTATLATTLPARRLPGIPPYTTGWLPRDDVRSRTRADRDWRRILFARRARAQLARIAGAGDWRTLYERAAAGSGYHGRFHHDAFGAPDLDLPQLVLCPRALDFPWAPAVDGMTYGAAFIAPRRDDRGAADDRLTPDDRRLVYCSFGSQGHRLGGHLRLMRALVAAMAHRPQLRLLLAIGDHLPPDALSPLPPNVEVRRRVRQLEALSRAALFITHGGLNSIKESIHFGVPMLVAPIGFDQPGNAARVVHHGLGRRLTPGAGERVGVAIDAALADDAMRAATRAMQRRFAAADAAGDGLEVVERLLRGQRLEAAS